MNEDPERLAAELAKVRQAIDDAQRKLQEILSKDQLEAALEPLRQKEAALLAQIKGTGAVAQGSHVRSAAAENDSLAVSGDVGGHLVIAKKGARVIIGEEVVAMPAIDRASALGRYLQHLISRNRYLQLQGIRSGGRLVHIELDQIYVALRATREHLIEAEDQWLSAEAARAPGEQRRMEDHQGARTETVAISVNEALQEFNRLVILGDPGSGKTTLLRYLALFYARDLTEGARHVADKLGLEESGAIPILILLRQIGKNLAQVPEDGTEGHRFLLDFLLRSLKSERIDLPEDFFDAYLHQGKALILLDGVDEIADPDLRRRVSRMVEAFTRAYPACRYVVTSRVVGYTGAARLGEDYKTAKVRDFTLADVEKFLTNWHRSMAIGQMGPGEDAEAFADRQTRQLVRSIHANMRIRELAINPLMLTVIAMVHRDRVKLPDRRAELYAEAVEVLLGKWDEARGVADRPILDGKPFDIGDRRLILQHLAFQMQERQVKEISAAELQESLGRMFREIVGDRRTADSAVRRFLQVIQERSGLLIARDEGRYTFSHLTFQEYLAALALCGREDYIHYTLKRSPADWWREVILLAAGYLSTQSRERTTRLIRAIADLKAEPEPFHNLVLAAECLRDVGANRVQADLEAEVQRGLRQEIEKPPPLLSRWLKKFGPKDWIEHRRLAVQALVRAGAGFWSLPHGEPEWVKIPSGDFWMGSEEDEKSLMGGPLHKRQVDTCWVARVPVTHAQYQIFVQASQHQPPEHWEDDRPPKGLESHPVVWVSWHDAAAYCEWLSNVTDKTITLPSESQWEKACRGSRDQRAYPWGDGFDASRCNSRELGLGQTTPVGIFPQGASPYGCLDMAGNVWEWCRTKWQDDYQDYQDDNTLGGEAPRVLRGGSFYYSAGGVRCAVRYGDFPYLWNLYVGFRVVLLGSPSFL